MSTEAPTWAVEGRRLGKELRRLRTDAGLTLRQLAAAVPMNHTHLKKIETGMRSPRCVRYWLPLVAKVALDEQIRREAALRITALERQERVEDIVARHVSKKMRMAR